MHLAPYHNHLLYLIICTLDMSKDSAEFIRKLVTCPELTDSDIDVALTAAGVDELLPDGNRILAQLGLAATGFLIDSSVAFIALSRGINW